MEIPTWEPEFLDLWPTLLVKRRFGDCEEPNRMLVELVEELDSGADQLTAHYRDLDIFSLDRDGIRWLRNGIEETLDAYFAEVGLDYPVGRSIRGWANINRRGDYHAPHNHAWSYLSGTYYVKMPRETGDLGAAGQASPAAISYYDPRVAVNMLALGGEAQGLHEYTVKPEAGTLLLWHASLTHSVQPNLSEDTRISISFNIALAWDDRFVAADAEA